MYFFAGAGVTKSHRLRVSACAQIISCMFVLIGCAGSVLLLGLSLDGVSRGCSLGVERGLLIGVTSLVGEHGRMGFSSCNTRA